MSEFIAVLSHNQWLFLVLCFLFASVIGSFLNVVIHRLPVMMKREWQQECNQYLQEYQPEFAKQLGEAKLNAPIDNYPAKYNLLLPKSACPSVAPISNPGTTSP